MKIRRFDPIAEASEVPDHLPSAKLLRSLGDRRAPLFVTDSLVQDQPDQPTLSMGNDPDGLIVSESRDRAAIYNFENASFGSGCGVSSLITRIVSRLVLPLSLRLHRPSDECEVHPIAMKKENTETRALF
jgi:hypothetical protein